MKTGGRRRALLPALAALLGAAPGDARAQRTIILPQPRGTAVALVVNLNAGGIWDPVARAGVSRVAAESILEGVRAELQALGAGGRVDCDRFGLRIVLLSAPATWQRSAELLLNAVFHPAVRPEAFERARERLARSLRFQAGDPAAEIRVAAHEALFGKSHRWARAACGQPETVDSLTVDHAQAAAAQRFTSSRAAAAIAGPLTRPDARALLERTFGDAQLPALLPRPSPASLPGSRDIESPTVTTWIAVAFPLPRHPDDEAARLLAFRLADALRPSADRPKVVDAGAEVERYGGGGALIVYVAADPAEGRRWARRAQSLVAAAAATPLDDAAFQMLLRRYRGERLLELTAPEALAADAADRLFFDNAYVPPAYRIDALTPQRLRAAAAALEPPAIAYLGPDPRG